MYQALYGIDYIALRASNPYGPRQSHNGLQGVIGTYISNINSGQDIEIWGDGSVVRDFIYIEDLIMLCLQTIESNVNGCFNAGSGEGRSILQIVAELESILGYEIEPVFKKGRNIDVPIAVLDISQSQHAFSWSPKMNLRDGLRFTLEDSRDSTSSKQLAA
jgi:UDP-glucose 4-epimerase